MTRSIRLPLASLRWVGGLVIAITLMLSSIAAASVIESAPDAARHGVCVGGPSRWRLRVTPDDAGMLVVRFRIAGGAPGETWNVFLDSNGVGFFAGSRVSNDTGIVRVWRRTVDRPGVDVVRAAAHDVVTGEICRGRVQV